MIKRTKKISILVMISLIYQSMFSQDKDFIGWGSVGVDKKISNKIRLDATVQLRIDNNLLNIESWLYSADLKYKLNKKWSGILQTRYRTSDVRDVLRFGGGINYDFKINDFKIDLRQLYQLDMPMYYLHLDENNSVRHQLRTRLKTDYNFSKKLSSSISAEAFLRFNDRIAYLARVRYALVFEYEFINNTTLFLQYLYQPNFDPSGPLQRIDYIGNIGVFKKI